MELLNRLEIQRLCAIDIETVRLKEKYSELSDTYKLAWQYKNKQDGKVPSPTQLGKLWVETAALYPEFSKVCAVSLVFHNGEQNLECIELANEDEKVLLDALINYLDRLKTSKYTLVGHAAKYFDYPFLCKRYVINKLPIPAILDTAHLKPWENTNICTNHDVWKMGGTGPGSSLIALCVALGIPISKVDLVGDEVGKAYFEGKLSDISRYCSYDAIATMNIVRVLKGMNHVEFDNVNYK